ncbi:F-box protein CPR1-like [Telopea speciosissima]|uniref:F-box protein CPR1-like n=1 Tax=Telopea speciosissima TaxID=54955 RepID=UPI001CC6B2A7|nr:F-box protein CPR1-like [Telopea speciosissima]
MAAEEKKKISTEEEATPTKEDLREDLIADILSRLPVKSLLRLRRHQKLPTIKYSIADIGHGFGYDPTTNDYKLIKIGKEVKVYSLSTNSWRNIGSIPFYFFLRHDFGVFANSALHWVSKCEHDTTSSFILSFDLKDEKFREVPLPDSIDNLAYDKFHMHLRVLGGQLCIFYNFFMIRVEIWVMKDYGVRDSWVKQFSIEQPSVMGSFLNFSIGNGEVLFRNNKSELVLYDPRRGRERNLRICGVTLMRIRATCVGSLVPLNAKDEIQHEQDQRKTKRPKKGNNNIISFIYMIMVRDLSIAWIGSDWDRPNSDKYDTFVPAGWMGACAMITDDYDDQSLFTKGGEDNVFGGDDIKV